MAVHSAKGWQWAQLSGQLGPGVAIFPRVEGGEAGQQGVVVTDRTDEHATGTAATTEAHASHVVWVLQGYRACRKCGNVSNRALNRPCVPIATAHEFHPVRGAQTSPEKATVECWCGANHRFVSTTDGTSFQHKMKRPCRVVLGRAAIAAAGKRRKLRRDAEDAGGSTEATGEGAVPDVVAMRRMTDLPRTRGEDGAPVPKVARHVATLEVIPEGEEAAATRTEKQGGETSGPAGVVFVAQ